MTRLTIDLLLALLALTCCPSRNVLALTPDGANWIHPSSPFTVPHQTPTRHVGPRRTRLQTDPYGMPSYGKLDDDAFVPVQEDPSRAVLDFGKPGKSILQELEERKRAVEAAALHARQTKSSNSFAHQRHVAEASFRQPTSSFDNERRATAEASFRNDPRQQQRYAAEAAYRRSNDSFAQERSRTAQSSFRRPNANPPQGQAYAAAQQQQQQRQYSGNSYDRRQQQQQRYYRGQQKQQQQQRQVQEFERQEYSRTPQDWLGPSQKSTDPVARDFFSNVRPTLGGDTWGQNLAPFFQDNPLEFFSGRPTTSYANRPLQPNFY